MNLKKLKTKMNWQRKLLTEVRGKAGGAPGKKRAEDSADAMLCAMRAIGKGEPGRRGVTRYDIRPAFVLSDGALPQHVLSPPGPGSPSQLVAFVREGG